MQVEADGRVLPSIDASASASSKSALKTSAGQRQLWTCKNAANEGSSSVSQMFFF
jgi:hypothetical protein